MRHKVFATTTSFRSRKLAIGSIVLLLLMLTWEIRGPGSTSSSLNMEMERSKRRFVTTLIARQIRRSAQLVSDVICMLFTPLIVRIAVHPQKPCNYFSWSSDVLRRILVMEKCGVKWAKKLLWRKVKRQRIYSRYKRMKIRFARTWSCPLG